MYPGRAPRSGVGATRLQSTTGQRRELVPLAKCLLIEVVARTYVFEQAGEAGSQGMFDRGAGKLKAAPG